MSGRKKGIHVREAVSFAFPADIFDRPIAIKFEKSFSIQEAKDAMAKLSEEEIAGWLGRAAGWSREESKWIVKKYRFSDYLAGIAFVQAIARIAELELNHHPFIAIDYKLVTVRLTSWHAGGLTSLDFEASVRFDEAFAAGKPEGPQGRD